MTAPAPNLLAAAIATVIIGLLGTSPANAGNFKSSIEPYVGEDFEDAYSAYIRHDYGEALPIFSWLARFDYPPAQTMLAEMYLFGQGIPPDPVAAAMWFKKAADHGEARSQYELGALYAKGSGTVENDQEAFKWFWRSAESGYSDAENILGRMYLGYKDIALDYATAASLFLRAANSYNPEAMLNLGLLYQAGLGVQFSNIEAYKWYDLASSKAASEEDANKATRLRDSIAAQMKPNEIAIARDLARVWAPTRPTNAALAVTQTSQEKVKIPGTAYEFELGSFAFPPSERFTTEALLTSLVTWISDNLDIPADYHHPNIVPMSSVAMTNLLYRQFLGDKPNDEVVTENQGQSEGRRRVLSLYNVPTKTIYLLPGWTGRTPAELSMLVHELVHHLQNVGHIDYACPQEREQLAYEAQEKWLNLFGLSLSSEFGLDRTTLVFSTTCME